MTARGVLLVPSMVFAELLGPSGLSRVLLKPTRAMAFRSAATAALNVAEYGHTTPRMRRDV